MAADGRRALTSVKRSVLRHPVALGAGSAAALALLGLNLAAFYRGLDSPGLLGPVIIADMLGIGAAVVFAARGVLLAEEHTAASRAQLESIVDSAMDAIITIDAAQNVVVFNRAAEQVFRCSRSEALGRPLERFLPQRFRGAHHGHLESFGRTGVTGRRMGDATSLWALRADGTEFPIEASISQSGNPGGPGGAPDLRLYTVVLRDITLRKQYEDALKRSEQDLHELSARVAEAREDEKARIARELHDELGQHLSALKMDLAALNEKISPSAAPDENIRKMQALLDQTVAATRRIAADLRPLMLDDLGLADAASWLVHDFAERSGLHCEIRFRPEGPIDDVSKPVSVALYRAVQESLTNIGRHAGASNAWVQFSVENGTIHVEIEDDGRGIALQDLGKGRSLGLLGMRERIAYLGGAFDVGRAPRGGTRVRIRVPMRGLLKGGAA